MAIVYDVAMNSLALHYIDAMMFLILAVANSRVQLRRIC